MKHPVLTATLLFLTASLAHAAPLQHSPSLAEFETCKTEVGKQHGLIFKKDTPSKPSVAARDNNLRRVSPMLLGKLVLQAKLHGCDNLFMELQAPGTMPREAREAYLAWREPFARIAYPEGYLETEKEKPSSPVRKVPTSESELNAALRPSRLFQETEKEKPSRLIRFLGRIRIGGPGLLPGRPLR